MIKTEKGQLLSTKAQLPSGTLKRKLNHRPIISQRAKKINRTTMAIAISIGLSAILTPLAIKAAYIERGYLAYGGEYLIPILATIIGIAIANTPEFIADMKSLLDEADK